MRHLRAGKKLNRNASHRLALYRNLTMALIQHERITTTLAKAKAVRPFVEKLITLAKKGTLHHRRLAIARLGPAGNAKVKPNGETQEELRTIIQKLFDEIGPRFAERNGGYTRIIKRSYRRLGDAGVTAFLELLKEGETKVMARQPREAAAPEVEEEGEEQEETGEQEEGTEETGEQQEGSEETGEQEEGSEETGEQEEGTEGEEESSDEGDEEKPKEEENK
jgi:large subunit ribosomal protein L17